MTASKKKPNSRDPRSPDYHPSMDDVIKNLWSTVQYWEMRVAAFCFATKDLPRYRENSHYSDDYSAIHQEIYSKLLDAYRNLFMLGNFLDEKDRKEIKKRAYDRFMKDGQAIMYLLDYKGEQPGRYWSDVEKRLREVMRLRI